jgi:hypothetical protein
VVGFGFFDSIGEISVEFFEFTMAGVVQEASPFVVFCAGSVLCCMEEGEVFGPPLLCVRGNFDFCCYFICRFIDHFE